MSKRPVAAIVVGLTLSAAGAALAEEASSQREDAATKAGDISEVVVTGTRLKTGFDTPTPVAMYQADDLAAAAPTNVGEALAQLPSLVGSVQNSTSGTGSAAYFTNGQNLLNLRQLGYQRTLVLLNGQRMGVTNVVNSVDINIIPQNLISRVDVVTGGASASYGSDAVAGVVNFILDTKFEGLKAEISGGMTTYHDAENGRLSVAFGRALGERARVVAAAEYFRLHGMTYGHETGRDWFDHPTGAWPNPLPGSPTIVVVPNARSQFGTFGGTITAVTGCPVGAAGAACRSLINQKFLPGGALAPMQFGTYAGGGFAGGGDGVPVNQVFTPDMERESVFLHGEFDLRGDMTLWGEASFNRNYTYLRSQPATQNTTTQFSIYEDNAYLPDAVKSILAATPGVQRFSLTRYDRDFGLQADRGNTEVKRFAAGIKGSLTGRWSYDATATYQDSLQELDVRGTIQRNLFAAADAAVDPATGKVVCRSTLAGLDAGCVPLNLFADGSVSKEAADYVMGWNTADVTLKQATADPNVHGDFGERFALAAGPISFAGGVSYRRTTADRTVDPLSAIYIDGTGIRGFPSGLQGRYGGYQFYNPSPLSGTVSAKEAYAEIGVPLLKDKPLVRSLTANLAGRLTDYSQSGTENMWKLGLNWAIADSVRVRGTISADTRAPSVLELFNTASVTQGRNTVPYSASPAGFRSSGQNVTTGNPNLMPEKDHTYTAGIVLSPAWAPSLQASIDWYEIDITGVITTPGAQNIIDNCYDGDQVYCQLIQVNGQSVTTTTGITADDFVVVHNPTMNLGTMSTSGLDFAAAYRMHPRIGRLLLQLNGNYLLSAKNPGLSCPNGTSEQNLAGSLSGIISCGIYPRLTARLVAKYELERFGLRVQERYIDSGKKDPNFQSGVDITSNEVPSVWYTDLELGYELGSAFGGKGSVFLDVTNLFDKDPPPTSIAARSWIEPTINSLYDVLGRRYLLGVRFRM